MQVVGWLEKRYTLCGHWSDMAVLCPAEFSVKHLKEVMTQRGIPYATCFDSEGKKKYSRRKDVVHLLTYQSKRTARAVLTGMSYSAGSAMRHGSSSLTRLTGQSAMTPSTWRR